MKTGNKLKLAQQYANVKVKLMHVDGAMYDELKNTVVSRLMELYTLPIEWAEEIFENALDYNSQ